MSAKNKENNVKLLWSDWYWSEKRYEISHRQSVGSIVFVVIYRCQLGMVRMTMLEMWVAMTTAATMAVAVTMTATVAMAVTFPSAVTVAVFCNNYRKYESRINETIIHYVPWKRNRPIMFTRSPIQPTTRMSCGSWISSISINLQQNKGVLDGKFELLKLGKLLPF